ncbi:hypothetical protein AVEN_75979-1 [Araneus ventricosus]|uniref:Uncharacterized protein n=1 Tax=Araneus ventricosus TaxID=182803 RepID=A0A4Y2PYZ2_ARAVE|nr:hypothetical protein AVEN_75979-1 [Araneus ventricosus]
MASPQEQAQVVAWFIEFKSATQVQRKLRITYKGSPPSRPTIYEWHERFMTTSSVLPKPKSARPSGRTCLEISYRLDVLRATNGIRTLKSWNKTLQKNL